jgi:hypothetical protein
MMQVLYCKCRCFVVSATAMGVDVNAQESRSDYVNAVYRYTTTHGVTFYKRLIIYFKRLLGVSTKATLLYSAKHAIKYMCAVADTIVDGLRACIKRFVSLLSKILKNFRINGTDTRIFGI